MESPLNILSLNVGMSSTLAGLNSLILSNNLDLVLLQEVKVSKEQLNAMLSSLDFQAEVNLDTESPTLPGTAIAWRNSLPVEDVFILVKCRAQIAVLGQYVVVNLYAPSGSDKRSERNNFYRQDVFKVFPSLLLHTGW